MRAFPTIWVAVAVAAALGTAQTPPEQQTLPAFDASVRIVYESDTRAYYRPCG